MLENSLQIHQLPFLRWAVPGFIARACPNVFKQLGFGGARPALAPCSSGFYACHGAFLLMDPTLTETAAV